MLSQQVSTALTPHVTSCLATIIVEYVSVCKCQCHLIESQKQICQCHLIESQKQIIDCGPATCYNNHFHEICSACATRCPQDRGTKNRTYCLKCIVKCTHCSRDLCLRRCAYIICDGCAKLYCCACINMHKMVQCGLCSMPYCVGFVRTCVSCTLTVCSSLWCFNTCVYCKKSQCQRCNDKCRSKHRLDRFGVAAFATKRKMMA
jgi:hypothetical protein